MHSLIHRVLYNFYYLLTQFQFRLLLLKDEHRTVKVEGELTLL